MAAHATLRSETVRVILVLCSIVIIGREIAISALREWMAEIGQRGKVKVSQLAKYKTILQIVGLSCILFRWNLWIIADIRNRPDPHRHRRVPHAAVGDLVPAGRAAGSAGFPHDPLGLRVLRFRAGRAA